MAFGPLGLIDLDHPPLTIAQPIIELAEQYLLVPTGLGAGEPLKLSAEQVELLWAWYSVTPNGRRFIFDRKLILRMSKGWAKSPIGAVDNFAGLVGPVVPDGLDTNGQPVGRPHPSPWLQVAATAEDQTDNLYRQLFEMLRDSDALDDFRLDLGLTRIQFRDRAGWIEPVTSSAGAREGQPVSGVTKEETHLWKFSNGGRALSRVLDRNATKMGARTLELTNAYVPGAGSVAESSEKAYDDGRGSGVLLVRREAAPISDDDVRSFMVDFRAVRKALEVPYGLASKDRGGWVDLDRVANDIVDSGEDDWPEMRRFYFNHVTAPEEAPVDLTTWAQLANADARLVQGDVITIGFDGAETRDSTALYACRWPDWLVVKLGVWERPRDENGKPAKDWRAPTEEIKQAIRNACATYRVVRGYADDAGGWRTTVDELNGELGNAFLAFSHRIDARIGPAAERFSSMVAQQTLRHTGEPTLPSHIANARKVPIGKEGSGWYRPAKRTEGQEIDALLAAISAVHAMGDAVAHDEVAEPEKASAFVAWG